MAQVAGCVFGGIVVATLGLVEVLWIDVVPGGFMIV